MKKVKELESVPKGEGCLVIVATVLILAMVWSCSQPTTPKERLSTCLERIEQKHSSRLETLEEVRGEQGYTKGAQMGFDSAKTKWLKEKEKRKCYDRFYKDTR